MSRKLAAPPVDVGLFPDRTTNTRWSGVVDQYDIVFATGARIPLASEYPAQVTNVPTSLMRI